MRSPCSLQEAAGRKLDYQEVIETIVAGFREIFAINLFPGKLTPEEIANSERILNPKKLVEQWTEKN